MYLFNIYHKLVPVKWRVVAERLPHPSNILGLNNTTCACKQSKSKYMLHSNLTISRTRRLLLSICGVSPSTESVRLVVQPCKSVISPISYGFSLRFLEHKMPQLHRGMFCLFADSYFLSDVSGNCNCHQSSFVAATLCSQTVVECVTSPDQQWAGPVFTSLVVEVLLPAFYFRF